jgi:hypothetical protein
MIGRAFDRLLDNAIIFIGDLAHDFFESHWPQTPVRPAWMVENPLAEAEAGQEVWEPRPFSDTDDIHAPINNIAIVKRILDDRLDAAEIEPFDKWLTTTAVEIINALHQ